jgi:kojibiose phosphorylase
MNDLIKTKDYQIDMNDAIPNQWLISEASFDPENLHTHETIFTQGNGYLGTRGAFEEYYPNEQRTTFVHGVFDDRPIFFTELVNFPDWLALEIILDGERFSLAEGELLAFERHLDLRTGLLSRTVRWRNPKGQTTRLHFQRFASLADQHLACLQVRITAEDYAGAVEIRSGLNAAADNLGFNHWEWLEQGAGEGTCWLKLQTKSTGVKTGMAMRLSTAGLKETESDAWDVQERPTLVYRGQVAPGQAVRLEKIAAVYTSREAHRPLDAAQAALARQPEFAWDGLWAKHARCWQEEWRRCDILIEGDDEAQLAVRFNLYHLLIAAPRTDDQVNIAAKTLSGYGYRGHVFWDTEVFMLPFFTYTRPEIARNLLAYRFHRLSGAREKAADNGFEGAQYPWESAGDGREVTPTWVPNQNARSQMIRIWTGDIEIHISTDIAYAVWQYWLLNRDDDFLVKQGAEIILDTARFWASRLEWDQTRGLFVLTDVIGPDEYHEHVDNNAFTNYFVRWHLRLAAQVANLVKEQNTEAAQQLLDRLGLKNETLERWQQMADKIFFPINEDTGLIEQFEGYLDKKDIDLAALEPRTESIQSLLGIEGVNKTQALKQPDVMMLIHLLQEDFDTATFRANYEYYTPRTDWTYGSSLGPSIQSILDTRVGHSEEAYSSFIRAARVDLDDLRNNTADGIHGASAGGVWQAVVFGFAGLRVSQEEWTLTPNLPAHWKRLAFKFVWQGEEITIDLPGDGGRS